MNALRRYLLPGLVFQSIVIGGGYGTGRELVEFFMASEPRAGLLGMAVATVIWSVVTAVTFEVARMSGSYDYRSFITGLLRRGWIAFEVTYLVLLVLVVSVLGSAAGEIVREMTGLPLLAGNMLVIGLVGVLAFYGSSLIERVMSFWSFALYAVFAVVVIRSFDVFSAEIGLALAEPVHGMDWVGDGARYAAYNVGLVPAFLFVVRHLETRRQALLSGALAGVIAMVPGVLIFLAMLGRWPSVAVEAVPSDYLLAALESPILRTVFQVVLFGTFVETGVGLVHGFNERVAAVMRERGRILGSGARMAIAAGLLVVSMYVAEAAGLVAIIASGYGTITWAFWLVFVIPVLTLGVWRVWSGGIGKPSAGIGG